MRLEQSFEIEAPLERVWDALIDVERVAPCLPGAEVTQVDADGTYHGTFQVKLGPTTAAYRGKLTIESLDEAAHVATMAASGIDKRGQGGAKAMMRSTLSQVGTATRVHVENDFIITGRLARFGRSGMAQDVFTRLLHEFADCVRSILEAPLQAADAEEGEGAPPHPPAPASRPASGLRLLLGALLDRLRRLLGRER
jgi:uncharacterized protein